MMPMIPMLQPAGKEVHSLMGEMEEKGSSCGGVLRSQSRDNEILIDTMEKDKVRALLFFSLLLLP